MLTIERLSGFELLPVACHEADASRSTPHGDMIRKNICPGNAAVKFPGDRAIIPLVIGKNLVKFDGNIGGRERLGQKGTESRLWDLSGLAFGTLDTPGAFLPSRPSNTFAPKLTLWPSRSDETSRAYVSFFSFRARIARGPRWTI